MSSYIHSKSNLVVANYVFVLSWQDYVPVEHNPQYRELTELRISGKLLRPRQCSACGQRHYRSGAVVKHLPTGDLIELGWQCADLLELGQDYVDAKRERLSEVSRYQLKLRQQASHDRNQESLAAWRAEHADVLPWLQDPVPQPIPSWRRLQLEQIRRGYQSYGTLLPWQVDKVRQIAADSVRTWTTAPVGTHTITGTILSLWTSVEEYQWRSVSRSQCKLAIDTPEGRWTVQGTVPAAILRQEPRVGDTITVTAEIAPNRNDPSHSYWSRPRKALLQHAVPDGYRVYEASEAGSPEAHELVSGEAGGWYYQPEDAPIGEVWSERYDTRAEAVAACRAEAQQPS